MRHQEPDRKIVITSKHRRVGLQVPLHLTLNKVIELLLAKDVGVMSCGNLVSP